MAQATESPQADLTSRGGAPPVSDIARKSFKTLITRIVIQICWQITNIVIARAIGPYGKGIYTYANTIFLGFQNLSAGQSGSVSLQLGRRKQPGWLVYSAMLRVWAWYAIPATVGLVAIALLVPGQRVLLYVACAVPFALFAQLAAGFYNINGNIRALNIQQLIRALGILIVILLLLATAHLGLTTLLATWAASAVAVAVYSGLVIRQYLGGRAAGDTKVSIFKDQFSYGLRMALNSLAAYLNFRIDVFIVLSALGPRALGVYSIGIGFGEMMWQLSRPLQQAAFSRIGKSGPKEAARVAAKGMRHSIAMVSAISLVVLIFAPTLVTLVYGKAFAASGNVVRLLVPGMITYSAMPMLNTYFNQQLGRPILPLIFNSVSAAVCAVITLSTIHRFGMVAGAVATSASYVTAFSLATAYFVKKTGTPLRSIFIFDADDFRHYYHLISDMWIKGLRLAGRRA